MAKNNFSYGIQIRLELADDIEMAELEPVDLKMAWVKEISADWIVHMADYITQNPQFIVNGFVHAGITGALDGRSEYDVPDQGDASSSTSDPDEDKNEIVDT